MEFAFSYMKNIKLLYTSSYDRGLEHLLALWSQIRAKHKNATLDIAYGWDTFNALAANNPERMAWKEEMVKLMQQDGITDHGRIGKAELTKLQEKCGILAYPSHFFEIFCIGVVEAQLRGCVPVTTSIGALPETNKNGIVVNGDITKLETQKEYLKQLLSLMNNEDLRKSLSEAGKAWAKKYDWKQIAHKWSDEFDTKDKTIKLTIYTPTIRKGWWNIMADNLSKQSYKNFEWIIVDDYPEDRSKIAEEYATKYKLNIRYMRGKKRNVQRKYGLCNANNTVLDAATGEVLIFLQDFILMPLDGLEQIATLYRKNPTALQALPDMYFAPKVKPDKEKEDWFNGETEVIGEFIRQNIRLKNLGLRETENPMDFEQNYGAIPIKVARELGGWHEFFDEGLGWDNTDIAWRALQKGYKILLDETNVAVCIDHWKTLEGTKEHGLERERRLNDPRYYWMQTLIQAGKMGLIRTQEEDDSIDLQYTIPKEVKTGDEVVWLNDNMEKIILEWLKPYERKE